MCDDDFDINDANVVCRQLGYPKAIISTKDAPFGEGSGPIWLDNLHCLGNETALYDCRHNGFDSHNCRHNEDAGVICQGTA